MIDVLNSVLIKHDNSFKSLTKIALAQIILKIVYEQNNGIIVSSIKHKLEEYVGSSFRIQDIEDALTHLKNSKKLNHKANKYYIFESYKSEFDNSVRESENLHKNVIKYWFSNSETFKSDNGNDKVHKWFNRLLVVFFKEYRYDWINDLRKKRVSGNRKSFNIDKILTNCFEKSDINDRDKSWFLEQFKKFLESDRTDDNGLLWYYGASMFSSTLLTANNYADEFSLEMFRDSNFILDTNILMTIGLEGQELYYSFQPIEEIFKTLNITPIYFYITKEEYRKAIARKRQATGKTLDVFGYDVVKQSGCGIIATAIKRRCQTEEDFNRFFDELEKIPDVLYSDVKINLEDYKELAEEIEKGQFDENIIEKINKININRIKRPKSKNVLSHDAGLVSGAFYLNNRCKKSWILTKDGTIREYANENAIRNDNPIAIGLDSFIQIMAINSGNIKNSTENFAPLFAKIIQFSLLPEKDVFKVEDLYFILDTKIEIEKMKKTDIVEIAKSVNKLRVQNKPDDEIILEVRRFFQKKEVDYEAEKLKTETENFELSENNKRTSRQRDNLDRELVDTKYSSELNKLKTAILYNWLKYIGTPIFILLIITCLNRFCDFEGIGLYGSIISDIIAGLFVSIWRKPKLIITDKDKLHLSDRIKEEIEKIKNRG